MTRSFFVFIFLSLCASGCSTLTHSKPSLADSLSSSAIRIKVPLIVQQNEKSCGLAAVDMLMSYYGIHLNDPLRIQMLEEAASEGSIRGETLKQVLEEAGYRVAVFPGTLDYELTGLYRHLELGRPVIVLFGSSGSEGGHYCLVSGFDPKKDWILLVDPQKGEFATSVDDFLEYWERKGCFTLVAEPKSILFLNEARKNKAL